MPRCDYTAFFRSLSVNYEVGNIAHGNSKLWQHNGQIQVGEQHGHSADSADSFQTCLMCLQWHLTCRDWTGWQVGDLVNQRRWNLTVEMTRKAAWPVAMLVVICGRWPDHITVQRLTSPVITWQGVITGLIKNRKQNWQGPAGGSGAALIHQYFKTCHGHYRFRLQ